MTKSAPAGRGAAILAGGRVRVGPPYHGGNIPQRLPPIRWRRAGQLGATIQYGAWKVASAVVRRMPERLSYSVAFALGSIAYYCWPRARKAMRANYRRVLPGASRRERDRVARRSLVNYCKYLADFIRFPSIPAGQADRRGGRREPP